MTTGRRSLMEPKDRDTLRSAVVVLTNCCNKFDVLLEEEPDVKTTITETFLICALAHEVMRWLDHVDTADQYTLEWVNRLAQATQWVASNIAEDAGEGRPE